MQHRSATVSLFAGIAVSLLASQAFAAPAARCVKPQDQVDRTACAKAQEGGDALRRYVERTRMIHSLYFFDYVSKEDLDSAAAQPTQRVAQR